MCSVVFLVCGFGGLFVCIFCVLVLLGFLKAVAFGGQECLVQE